MHRKFHCEQIIIHQRSKRKRISSQSTPSPVYVSSYSYNILPKNKKKIPIRTNKFLCPESKPTGHNLQASICTTIIRTIETPESGGEGGAQAKKEGRKEGGARRVHERRSEGWRCSAYLLFEQEKTRSVEGGGRNPRLPWTSVALSVSLCFLSIP